MGRAEQDHRIRARAAGSICTELVACREDHFELVEDGEGRAHACGMSDKSASEPNILVSSQTRQKL